MRQLSHFLTLFFFLVHLNSKAQSDIQQDPSVDPMLKQVDAKRPGLTMFSRKDNQGRYVNMAVLSDSTHTLTWFTCYGQAFDAVRLTDDVYNKIKPGGLDPFNYYKNYLFNLLSQIRNASAQFRQKGNAVLNDTAGIYRPVYTHPRVQQARSTLQKEVAMEKLMSDLCLNLSLFDSPTPQRLTPNDSFQLRLQLVGRMVREGNTTVYYNANLLSSAARIVLHKEVPGKMFVYNPHGELTDSVPLKAGKYTALLNEKEDVFLLYRGWLELQSQQAISGREEVTRLLNREYTMPYKPASWKDDKQRLQQTLLEIQEQVDAVGSKVMGLIVPAPEETAHLLGALYRDKPVEISYLPGLGFAYAAVYGRGYKRYELTDHRANVMATVSDRKKAVDENNDGVIEYYNADVVNSADYYPFGMLAPGRTFNGGDSHRYGFNGKENDNEIKGEGNQQDYGMRIYDPRLGRFLSVDPITAKYPELTPYQFASNTPVWAIDIDGLEGGIGVFEIWSAIKEWWGAPAGETTSSVSYGWYSAAGIPVSPDKKYTNGDLIGSFMGAAGRASMEYHSGALMSGGASRYAGGRYSQTAEVEVPLYNNTFRTPQRPQATIQAKVGKPVFDLTSELTIVGQVIRAKKFTAQKDPDLFYSFDTEIIGGKITIPGKGPVTGQFDYVLSLDNKLKIGAGHFNLSEGATYVKTAGGLSIKQGSVKMFNNDTGHYLTTVTEGMNGFNMLKGQGLHLDGAWQQYYGANGKQVLALPPANKRK